MTSYTNNVQNQDDHCPICEDTGMVELAGTVTVHKITYSRGMAPCKWCEEGTRRVVRALSPSRGKDDPHRKWQPCEDYTIEDVVMPEPYEPMSKAEARAFLAQIRPTLGAP